MNINRILEIVLITYNRKPHLERTLEQLFADNSPVKNLNITVLDNASTDGSSELLRKYTLKYSNLKHLRHKKNIGGNANIVRAFETASMPYVWVICDDDSYHWKGWPEIEKALTEGNYDILLTRKDDLKGTSNLAKIIRQLSFLPSGIYKTDILTSRVIINMMANISNLFPHLVPACEVLNRKGSIFLPQEEVLDKTTFDITPTEVLYTKDVGGHTFPAVKNMFWTVGFINSIQFIEDKKLRNYVLENLGRHGFFGYIFAAFKKNYTVYKASGLNWSFVWHGLSVKNKIEFLFATFLLRVITLPQLVLKSKK